MSTLGRKAMKKTLERLKKDAMRDSTTWSRFMKKTIINLREKKLKMDREQRDYVITLMEFSVSAVVQLTRYVQALEDYGYELDEEWDKLLQSIEEAKQPKPTQKKQEAKKTSYIK